MSELATDYEGKITTRIEPAGSEEGQAAKVTYGWDRKLHGLVALLPDGTLVANLPGHSYAQDVASAKVEVKKAVEELLAANAR